MSDGASDPGLSGARAWVTTAVAKQPRTASPHTADLLERLCRAAVSDFVVAGAVIGLHSGPDTETVAAVSGEGTHVYAQLEFDLGEGPSRAAFIKGQPVSVADTSTGPWPAWGPAATAAGIRAVFAFPLQVGAAKFGVLSLYATVRRTLDRVEFARCLAMAEMATEILLASADASADGEIDPGLKGVLGFRNEVYQAQGMVTAALDLGLGESLALMRAHAFASDRDLDDVAVAIVAGNLQLSRDGP